MIGEGYVLISKEELDAFKKSQALIVAMLHDLLATKVASSTGGYITAKEFMDAVRIRRTKFDLLVYKGEVKTLKKGRKIYVPEEEVKRYFERPSRF